jgi:hypothetical protein
MNMEGPLVLFSVSKVAANTAFLVELRALALAVLAVQVLPRSRLRAISAAFSYRSLRCRGLQCLAANSFAVRAKVAA